MKKAILISTDTYYDLNTDGKKILLEYLNEFAADGNAIAVISNNASKRKELEDQINDSKGFSRREIRSILKKKSGEEQFFVVIGNKDQDFILANNFKILYIVPMWCGLIEDKAKKYGIRVDNTDNLYAFLKTLNNQNTWFYNLSIDEDRIYSLMCAQSYSPTIPKEEKEMVEGFSKFLKEGKRDYYSILLYHFLAGITNSPEFREVTDWCIFPSSGTSLNDEMLEFKEKVRCLMNSRIPAKLQMSDKNNLLLRTHQVKKSHHTETEERLKGGASKHFESIILNPEYDNSKWSLKGKVVCVLDDYLTHGNSFECARNILRAAGAKKVICVSLGTFKRNYQFQNYEIEGDLFSQGGYTHRCLKSSSKQGKFDESAREEVRKLHEIFNNI